MHSAARLLLASFFLFGLPAHSAEAIADFQARLPEDEVIYFLLPDRFENADPTDDEGGIAGGRLKSGFDPSDKGFYHGGDLKGVTAKLDYVRQLGATALWVGPVFVNDPVEGPPGHESAGYHGYWITDFTRIDPHFGTDADFKTLVDGAHARGMKIYMDIVVNHTADIIRYRECPNGPCPYRSRADYPYNRRGGPDGEAINSGFLGDAPPNQTADNFSHLVRPDFAYTPYVPPGLEHVKVPDWLNDPIFYHNRGNSTFAGESSTMGDFGGLDDVMTENPRVVHGFIDIYGAWIDRYGIDGFRIDTAQHVNPEFWQVFVPAMLTRARNRGIPNFHIFGEVATAEIDPAKLARHTHVDKLPSVLDFGFANAVRATVAGTRGTRVLSELFADDADYARGESGARQLATFISNHDGGRFGWFVRHDRPGVSDAEALERLQLAYAMLLTLRGAPVIYYGDEQGFPGTGDDQAAREDMFPTRVASYAQERLLSGATFGPSEHFNPHDPMFDFLRHLTVLRVATPALRRGSQITRADSAQPGIFAVSRFDPTDGHEILLAFNTSDSPLSMLIQVDARSAHFASLSGTCISSPEAPGSYRVTLAPRAFSVCESRP